MFAGLSNVSNSTDFALVFILGISAVVLAGLTAFMVYCCIRYSRTRNPVPTNIEGSVVLETTWTVIPTIIFMFMFWVGLGYNHLSDVPADAMTIRVTGWQWSWAFEYDNGKTNDTMAMSDFIEDKEEKVKDKEVPLLRIPLGKAVLLDMGSTDVLHSFYIPALRVKYDVLPGGRRTQLWFIANKVGVYQAFCTEYCGIAHSKMYALVEVMTPEDFAAWYGEAPTIVSPEEMVAVGKKVFDTNCLVCHNIDATRKVGPGLKGKYGATTKLASGKKVKADEDYLRKSITDPMADIVEGYPPAMAK
ncbi:cytochrome c oxidase subunit II, partial [bacterium]|nr:cytochrome c oxidase subunit II [bacterium]